METFISNTTIGSDLKPRSDEGFLDSDGLITEESLSQKLEKAGLGSNEDENENINGDDGGGALHPLRPYAEDCPFYIRTGTCKFGLNCRFNHPVSRANQKWGKEKEKENARVEVLEKPENIECKYYLTAEGCKYGKSCRYRHSKAESEIAPPELNFLGLPIRSGEKECPFYMRNGSCGYGTRCKFHHPDPTTVGGYDPNSSTPNDESIGQISTPAVHYNGESIPLNVASEASQPAQATWSTHVLSDKAAPFHMENHSPYMPTMLFLPQEALPTPEWNGYQAPYFPDQRTRQPFSPAAKETFVSSQVEEYPERPGVPECDYFTRTGTCNYKSACRYHHPRNQAPKADCVLNDMGLPLRPGRKICRHYEQLGICKFGHACLFDHPVNESSTFPVRSHLR